MLASFGVIGLGRMAQALLLPLIQAGLVDPSGVQAVVASRASAERLTAEHGLAVGTDPRAAWMAPVVLLAVKPQQLEAVAAAAPAGHTGLLVSVLAGVPVARLQRLFPGWRCVRAVPNTPSLVGQGLTGLSFAPEVTEADAALVQQLFARVGEVHRLPEPQLDAFLALTSSGPAFVALVAEAMADGAVAAGLPRLLAQHLAHRTLAGSAALLQEQALHPGQLKDMVSSPAGTTIAGLRQLERAGLRSALLEAVLAAAERSRELGADRAP
ncbi:pyrroline-5-carboxylate reductase [Cyanobium sp. NIES-981]|uniref:pyrroline-5-carboxylate reductase n=1 Tax=Cyanobium sp. NIES-981 TaxID=1851505 RepID=UPI0007DE1E0E|nr:pyrroline-5-carboxylate reductase [Cyanobium sp. NIES-981]SBO43436.1 Pyrroline-5-carboxylate reductase [Cyanobium sp. NIES-981]